jgi:hypothetical protein
VFVKNSFAEPFQSETNVTSPSSWISIITYIYVPFMIAPAFISGVDFFAKKSKELFTTALKLVLASFWLRHDSGVAVTISFLLLLRAFSRRPKPESRSSRWKSVP